MFIRTVGLTGQPQGNKLHCPNLFVTAKSGASTRWRMLEYLSHRVWLAFAKTAQRLVFIDIIAPTGLDVASDFGIILSGGD